MELLIKKSHSIKNTLFVLIIVFSCGLLGYIAFNKIASLLQVNKLTAFAQNLDYIPEAHLAEYKTCWGESFFPSRCGQILYYTTFLRREEFQVKVDGVASTMELPQNVDGYSLLDINLVSNFSINGVTKHILTIDGIGDSRDRAHLPEPLAYKWRFTEGGEKWVITFYEVVNDGHVYKMDAQKIVGNIVTIMLQTK